MSVVTVQYQFFCAKDWSLVDENTKEHKQGTSVTYAENEVVNNEKGFRGLPVTTRSISRDLALKLTKLPAKYEVVLKSGQKAKGGFDFQISDLKLIQ